VDLFDCMIIINMNDILWNPQTDTSVLIKQESF